MEAIEEALKTITARIKNHADTMMTEEAVKTAIILPFLRTLGYDIFNPMEVIPEFTADAVGKKGEKVDYAICIDDEIRILIECKSITTELESKHLSQLYRYFSVTNAKFAILTNGRYFRFYTDLDATNKLDSKPFFTFDITEYNDTSIAELKKFAKTAFDLNSILATAERLKYTSGIKQNLINLIDNPTEQFIRSISADVYEGRMTASVMEMLKPVAKSAFREIVSDAVKSRLSIALKDATASEEETAQEDITSPETDFENSITEEKLEAFRIIQAIGCGTTSVDRIFIRDAKAYCSVLMDDNNRKPLIRLHFNSKTTKKITLFDQDNAENINIEKLSDIYNYAERIRQTISKYL